ncbi:MAG: hypothetical protein K0R75_987 [Paenibacillaceae bacterium]|jgi:hypothetical protein|nr:hypothetical protein [Paenibacillaceae bacterium]
MDILGQLPYLGGTETRQINAENPTGEKGGACRWDPDPQNPLLPHSKAAVHLGRGWKVRPFIQLKAGEMATLADIQGPGIINQMWITSNLKNFSELVLRFYWDNEPTPSVEVPIGAFFAMGFDKAPHDVFSAPVTVAPNRGLNCYWQMPFRKHARVTLTNESEQDANIIAYKFLYKLQDVPNDAAYFHAQYRRSTTRRDYPEHVILDGVQGKGVYVGTYLAWNAFSSGWWGEGEVKFYMDGDGEFPTIADNGTEDYFGGAWCFTDAIGTKPERAYNSPYIGMPLARVTSELGGPRKFSLYRWHLLDAIGFKEDLRVTVQALGWWPNRTYQPLTDDIASVAYWYQSEPHQAFPQLPSVYDRWDR